MDQLQQALNRAGEIIRSMTPGARLTAGLAVACVAIGVAWSFGGRAANPDTPLLGGRLFSAAQLQAMVGAFAKAGLEDFQIDESQIRVPLSRQSKYMAALAEAEALPEDFGEYLRKAVNSGGFMLSGPRQEAQNKVAIQSDLQSVISSMRGIERASVHIAEQTGHGFQQEKTVTASVGVEPCDGQPIDENTVAAIRWYVANAWAGLKPQDVTVVDLSGNRLFTGNLESPAAAAEPNAAAAAVPDKRRLELDWQEKVSRALGIRDVTVTANVERDVQRQQFELVNVSVAVPSSHFDELWRSRQQTAEASATPDPTELAAIEQATASEIQGVIAALVDPAARTPQIIVSTIPAGAAAEVVAELPFGEVALGWLAGNWRTVGLGGLILVCLLLVRSTVRSVSAGARIDADADAATRRAVERIVVPDDEPLETAVAARAAPADIASRPSALRDELARMVGDHPQAAASVLRTWIGSVS